MSSLSGRTSASSNRLHSELGDRMKILVCFVLVAMAALAEGKSKVKNKKCTCAEVDDKIEAALEGYMTKEMFKQKNKAVVFTPNQYNYINWVGIRDKQTSLTFSVEACNDAHIGLFSGNSEKSDGYEIVLGGWGNTKSVIRRGIQTSSLAESRMRDCLVDCNVAKDFWISWKDGFIQIGPGHIVGERTCLSCTDTRPCIVHNTAISTGFGSHGSWKILD